ncbi:MAG: cadherin-like domain-containing protein, partial [Rhizobiales bacterium]|nr:cadherin-like domain-containing protein [Hyphomicrobiales bacterium]
SNNPPPPPDPTIEDDAGAVVEDGGGTSGTLNTAVVAQSGTPGEFGTFSIAADGAWTYVLNNESPAVQALAQGEVRTESFTVTGTNGATAAVVITITGTNDAPVAVADTVAAEFQTGTTFTAAELLSNDSDIDNPNTALSIAGVTSGVGGTVVLNLDGSVTFTPDEGFSGTATFTYTVTDGLATSAPVTVSVIVDGNDAPVASPVTLAAIAEDSGGRVINETELLAGVTDPDGPSLTITALSIAGGSGTLIDNGNGTWTYTPAANDDTGVTFNYTVSDGTSTASSTASLDITPVNDAPAAAAVTLDAIVENSGPRIITQLELLAGVTDPDGPALTITALSIAEGSGSLVDNGNGTWTYTPAENDDTGVTFNYTVSDGSLSSSSTASLDITPANEPPVLTGDFEADIENDGSYILTADDLGFSDPDDTEVVFTVSNLTNGVILVDGVAANSFTFADIENGLVAFQHDGSETSLASFDVSVEDGNEDGSVPESQTFTLHVTNYITGDENPNVLNGTAAVDVISGLEGADIITGNGDDDILIGGEGADTYVWNVGDGNDTIIGDNLSQDIIRIEGGPFYDYNFEIDGQDLLVGVSIAGEFDWSAPGGGYLRIQNFLDGGDTLAYLEADLGDNNAFYSPEGGDARIFFSAGTGIDQGHYYEVILGTEGNDVITDAGGTWINRLYGYGGDDTLIAADTGPSVLIGGTGNDTLIGGTNDDELRGGSGNDSMDGGDGYDVLSYRSNSSSGPYSHGVFVNLSDDEVTYEFLGANRTIAAGTALDNWWDPDLPTVGVDTIANVEAVIGTRFDDVIIGGSAGETISGGAGADIMDGGSGEAADFVSYYPPFGSPTPTQGVFVNISAAAATYDFNGQLDVTVDAGQALDNWGNTDTVLNFEGIIGSDLDDVLVAGFGDDYIEGGGGDDVIVGGGGFDYLVGGDGSDSFVFGTEWGDTWIQDFDLGTDFLRFQGDVAIESIDPLDLDEFEGDESALVTLTSGAVIILYDVGDIEDVSQLLAPPLLGNALANEINGTVFNDVIEGGEGNDTLNGRAGIDTYVWSEGDGYDTIQANNDGEDIIQINGSFYDFDWAVQGDDLVIGVSADDNYDWADVGGNLRLENFLSGNDSIDYLEADLGDNNAFYSPEGGNARIYVNLLAGADQGAYFELIFGTSGDDVMTDAGGTGINRFDGRDGNDIITASDGGNAVLIGGNGNDTLTGGNMNDQFRGGNGNDIINGGGDEGEFGGDLVRYDRPSGSGPYTHGVVVNLSDNVIVLSDDPGEGEYYFHGINGTVASNQAIGTWENLATWATAPGSRVDTDTLSGIESVRGSTFDDILIGSDGDNNIIGDDGDDTMIGGDGDDYFDGTLGSDYIDGGDGFDSVFYYDLNGVTINLADGYADEGGGVIDTLVNIEHIGGSQGADVLIGNDEDNFISGLEGDDYIDGGDGSDAVDYYGDPSGVIVDLDAGFATDGYGDTDTIVNVEEVYGSFNADIITGNSLENRLVGRDGDDFLYGGLGNDQLLGGEGDDELYGQDDDDILHGEAGDDIIDGGDGEDAIDFYDDPNGVYVNLEDGIAYDGYGGTDTLYSIERILGSFHSDELIGDSLDNYIAGRDGDDTIRGGAGSDYLEGGDGNDIFVYGADDEYGDADTIVDFDVGTDFLRLEDGLSIDSIYESEGSTTVYLSNFTTIDLIGVTGVTDPDDLLEPQNFFFSMAFTSSEDDAGSAAQAARLSDPDGQRHGDKDRKTHEIAFAQAAAAISGAAITTAQTAHASEPGMAKAEPGSHTHSAHNGHDWSAGFVPNHIPGPALAHQIDADLSGGANAHAKFHIGPPHDLPEIAGLRDVEPAGSRWSAPAQPERGHESGDANSVESGGARMGLRAAGHGEAPPAEATGHGDQPLPPGPGAPGGQPASVEWFHGFMLDAGPVPDLSSLPADGIGTHAFAKGLSPRAAIDLPAFDSVIDLRHDLFPEAAQHQNVAARALEHVQDIRAGAGEWAHAAAAEFVHNLASDLEAAVQTHDPR